MQNDFENDMAQRMQEFSIAPQPEIWQRVEAALPPEKKRRRIALWWWLLPLAVVTGVAVWFIASKQPAATLPATKTLQTTSEKQEIKQSIPAVPVVPASDSFNKKMLANTPAKEAQQITTPQQTSKTNRPGILIKTSTTANKKQAAVKVYASSNSAKQVRESRQKSNDSDGSLSAQTNITRAGKNTSSQPITEAKEQVESPLQNTAHNIPPSKTDTVIKVAKGDLDSAVNTAEVLAQKNINSALKKADTTAPVQVTVSKKITPYKKTITWMLEAGAGLSWQQFSVNRFGNYYSSPQFSTGPLTGQPNYIGPFQSPKSGYSLSIDIVRQQAITPRWSWKVALRYQLITSVQRAGYPRSISSGFDRTTTYSTGDTLSYHNYLHQLQVAPGITYTINPAAHSPIHLSTGFSVGYVFASKQLLPDYRTYVYAQSPQGLVKVQYAVEAGASMFFHKKINIGFACQYGLRNMAKPALQSIFKWQVLQVQVGVPLFHHSSK